MKTMCPSRNGRENTFQQLSSALFNLFMCHHLWFDFQG